MCTKISTMIVGAMLMLITSMAFGITGTVIRYDEAYGGLISPDGGGQDVSVDVSVVRSSDLFKLKKGQKVEFSTKNELRGPKVYYVRLLGQVIQQ